MSIDIKAMKELAKYAVLGKVPANFEQCASLEDVESTLRDACKELAPDYLTYERNKTYIFEIIQTAMDEVLPARVIDRLGQFAEIKSVPLGTTARFKIKTGRNRAKTFVTKAATQGIYETFRVDQKYVEVSTMTYGGAAAIDFERYLMGEEDFGEYTSIMMEGLEEAVYKEIWAALVNASTKLIDYNNYAKVTGSGDFYSGDEAKNIMKLVTNVKQYGPGAMILAPEPILQKFTNVVEFNGTVKGIGVPDSDINELKETGLIGKWRGVNLVQLPNTFIDDNNNQFQFNNGFGFVFPAGRDTKVVKVTMEGDTMVDDFKNRDRSMEIQAYKRFGIGIITYNDWAMFEDTTLSKLNGTNEAPKHE